MFYSAYFELLKQKFSKKAEFLQLPEIGLKIKCVTSDIIIDLGANIGELTSRFAKTGATVYAFEPDPFAFTILKKRFKFIQNVKCFNLGVMAKTKKIKLFFCNPDSNDRVQSSIGSSFIPGKRGNKKNAYKLVECISLVEFLTKLNRPIKLIKMDIEGAEVEVLDSLINSGLINSIEKIVVETHEKQVPKLKNKIFLLKIKISSLGLNEKINLNWI
jgi:FkbM family methyltransferase